MDPSINRQPLARKDVGGGDCVAAGLDFDGAVAAGSADSLVWMVSALVPPATTDRLAAGTTPSFTAALALY